MRGLLRRLRGILGTGLTWAFGWAGVSVVLSMLGGLPLQYFGQVVLSGLFRGFIAGGAFAVIFSIAERRHALEDLSLKRVAVWGGIGGSLVFLAAVPILLSVGFPIGGMLVPIATNALLGAGFASGSVALARWGDKELTDGEEPLPQLEEG
jgi:hypothetical protein